MSKATALQDLDCAPFIERKVCPTCGTKLVELYSTNTHPGWKYCPCCYTRHTAEIATERATIENPRKDYYPGIQTGLKIHRPQIQSIDY